jgi:serine/threonine-protein kinase
VPRCPACGSEADVSFDICPGCAQPLPWNSDVTRLSAGSSNVATQAEARRHASGQLRTSSSALSTSDIDHGRFAPGAILDARYRILGRLGRGGMGEVYRADDLKLGLPVALKFLAADVDDDPARLTQLHAEVRVARQVSHPNVCRVHDIGEYEGHTFLSMEYVDGEDLASLLRRVGRLPAERGVEIARQICAGLAAAHDRGVVHRDLKPANVMLDGNGRIRITDFGLAGASGESLRAGTPAYMAPEQIAGSEVTPRSDIYALGLVLYELFTGRRAVDARNLAELIAKREHLEITPPSELVRDLDPGIERVILKCLQPDPANRPSSALAVSAALPGGDPLAAALAAGETPSPELVAAAGAATSISRKVMTALGATILLGSAAVLLMYQHVLAINRTSTPKPPAALVDRAQEIVEKLGYGGAAHASAWGLTTSQDWVRYLARTSTDPHRWDRLNQVRPETEQLWYRTSPLPLVPVGNENPVSGLNPPLLTAGMALVLVDMSGRLSEFLGVPSPIETTTPAAAADFSKLFEAAGLDMHAFTPAQPQWVPAVFADERRAWEGHLPEVPDASVRIEAAAARGVPVAFEIIGPWSRSTRTAGQVQLPLLNRAIGMASTLMMPALMVVGALLARRNIRLGRGDRRGAFRAASAVFVLIVLAWLLSGMHVAVLDREFDRFFSMIGTALFNAALVWLAYLGLEPYVRRFSPDSLIGWTRLIAGGWRDSVVGRDVAIGVCAGLTMTVLFAVHNLVPLLHGGLEPMPVADTPQAVLESGRYALAVLFGDLQNAVTSGMLGVAGLVAFQVLLKRRSLAALAAIICFWPVVLNGMFEPGNPGLDIVLGVLITTAFVAVTAWAGLLATIATLATHFILLRAPLTIDLASWRAPATFVLLGAVLGTGLYGCWTAMGAPRQLHNFATTNDSRR